MAVLAVMHIYK